MCGLNNFILSRFDGDRYCCAIDGDPYADTKADQGASEGFRL